MNGSITQRSKGSWGLRYDGPAAATGKRKQINETVRGTRKEAESVLRERLTAVESGSYVTQNKETVAQFIGSWLDSYVTTHTTPRTAMGYRGIVSRYINPCLGGVRIQALTPRHVQNLHKSMLEKGLSNQSVVHTHRVLSKALKDATAWGVITKNPAALVSPPRPEQQQVDIWDMETITRFIGASQDSVFHEAFILALHTGMRRSEITGLRWEGVDLPGKAIRVTETLQRVTGHGLLAGQPKTKTSRRAIALGPTAVDLLHGLRGKQLALQAELGELYQNEAGYVFADELGKPIDSNRLSREFARVVKDACLPHATLHSLRHCVASLMLADGASIKAVAETLGHSNPSLTLGVYSHLLPTIQAQAAEALDRRLAGG